MWPQRDDLKRVAVRSDDLLLGNRFCVGVMAKPVSPIGQLLATATNRLAIKDDTRSAGIDEAADSLCLACFDYIARTDDIRPVVAIPTAPHTRLRGDMEDGIHTSASRAHMVRIGQIATDDFDSLGLQSWLSRTSE